MYNEIMYIINIEPRSTHCFIVSKFILRGLKLALTGTSSPFARFKAWKYEKVFNLRPQFQ